jgi:hypothetical protein
LHPALFDDGFVTKGQLTPLSSPSAKPVAKNGRYAPPVHIIKPTMQREITPYFCVHPDDDDRR